MVTTARRLSFFTVLTLCSFVFISSQALAGLVIERIHTQGTSPSKGKISKMITYYQDNKVKTVSSNGDYTIVDLEKGTMAIVNPKKKQYSLTTLDAMLGQMQAGMDKLKAHLKGISPEQRAMIEKMMGMNQPGGTSINLKKLGDSQVIAGYPAHHYVITQGGKKVAEYWVSEKLRNQMLREMDKDKIEKFEKAMSKISSQMNVFGNSNLTKLMELEQKLQKKGEIVKQIQYPNNVNMNRQGSYQEVTSVREQSLNPTVFEIPRGFKKMNTRP